MFNKKTVFIVGAGGSRELGLPVGDDLKTKIVEKLTVVRQRAFTGLAHEGIEDAFKYLSRTKDQRYLGNLYHAAQGIADAMPQALSIDNYLHAHADNGFITLVGKLAITASILEAEQESLAYLNIHSPEMLEFSGELGNAWHNTFCKMLTEGVQRANLKNLFSKVAFITFNYDRCIEHVLSYWLASYFRIDLEEAQALCRGLQIYHPYGQVGQLPWQVENGGVSFGSPASGEDLVAISPSVKTFTEREIEENVLNRMAHLLYSADRVVFLGFSYGDLNMQLLENENCDTDKRVFGTTLGISSPNQKAIESIVKNMLRSKTQGSRVSQVDFAEVGCNKFLQDYWRPLTQ